MTYFTPRHRFVSLELSALESHGHDAKDAMRKAANELAEHVRMTDKDLQHFIECLNESVDEALYDYRLPLERDAEEYADEMNSINERHERAAVQSSKI